jgi:hypothetical protein
MVTIAEVRSMLNQAIQRIPTSFAPDRGERARHAIHGMSKALASMHVISGKEGTEGMRAVITICEYTSYYDICQ